jgi:hypothetical protein
VGKKSNASGELFINLEKRRWDFKLNTNIQKPSHLKLLQRVFEKNIGRFTVGKSLKLKLKNPKKRTPFEASLLKNNCWRTDIFPVKSKRLRLNIKFCTPNLEKS